MEYSKGYVLIVGRSLGQTHPKPAFAATDTGRQPTGTAKNERKSELTPTGEGLGAGLASPWLAGEAMAGNNLCKCHLLETYIRIMRKV